MKRPLILSVGVGLALVLLLSSSFAGPAYRVSAQEERPDTVLAPQAPLGTAFTYQGYLENASGAVNGTCDFQFSLWDASANGAQVGSTQTKTGVQVDDGYFTVADLDFGAGVFTGEARYLQVAVKCSGDSDYVSLTGRVALNAGPYAQYALSAPWSGLSGVPAGFADGTDDDTLGGLSCANGQIAEWNGSAWACGTDDTGGTGNAWSLTGNSGTTPGTNFLGTTDDQALELHVNGTRALRLEPKAASPNLIGGYSGNSVSAGVAGATIGGGGSSGSINQVKSDYGTVGGGVDNTAGGYATVGGGANNTAGGLYAIVGGGTNNTASGLYATTGGGALNVAGDDYGTVSGGMSNLAGGEGDTVGGGSSNRITGTVQYDTIAGGYGNLIAGSASYSTIAGGASNQITGTALGGTIGGGGSNLITGTLYATVGGGDRNTASGQYATVPGGSQAAATLTGQMAYASGAFMSAGDAQASLYVMRGQTPSSGTWEDLYLDGGSAWLTLSPTRTLTFDVLIVGRSDAIGGNESAGYYCWGVIENVGGTTTLVGSWCNTLGEDDSNWDVRVVADDSKDALAVQVMGNGETIRWVATVRTAEVSW